jgi:hypothetical protein
LTDVIGILRVGLGVVLLVAATGKAISRPSSLDILLIAAEFAIASALFLGLLPVVSAVVTAGMTIGYLAYSFRGTQTQCRCFGAHLPTTSRSGQQWRNAALSALALTYAWAVLAAGQPPRSDALSVGLGVLLGAAVITFPWLNEWSLGNNRVSD